MDDELAVFCACLPGLEPLLAAELRELEIAESAAIENGGVAFRGDLDAVHRVNLESGLSAHVLLRLGEFGARSLGELVRKTARLPWPRWLRPDRAVTVRATCRQSRLYHSDAVAQRVHEGIMAALGATPAPDDGVTAQVAVRMHRDRCTLSLDTSGEPLHRRGWRLATGKAPLREDLARALLLASGWDRRSPLVDPFCGSGTIAIEAALLARALPPGAGREFALFGTALFDASLWARVRDRAMERSRPAAGALILASDRDRGATRATRDNAERAEVDGDVRVVCAALSGAPFLAGGSAPPMGWIVSNPPFGHRIGTGTKLRSLYQSLGHRIAALPPAWRVALLTAYPRLTRATGLPLRAAFLAPHGGLTVSGMVRSD